MALCPTREGMHHAPINPAGHGYPEAVQEVSESLVCYVRRVYRSAARPLFRFRSHAYHLVRIVIQRLSIMIRHSDFFCNCFVLALTASLKTIPQGDPVAV